jgi:hypothetical protein
LNCLEEPELDSRWDSVTGGLIPKKKLVNKTKIMQVNATNTMRGLKMFLVTVVILNCV